MSTTLTQDEIKAFKGRGWLLNKGTDSFSARVVTVNGKHSADKLLAVAEAARNFGSGEVPSPPVSPSSLKARTRYCRSSTARFPSTATTASRANVRFFKPLDRIGLDAALKMIDL